MSNVVKEIDTKIGFKEASRDPQLFEKTFTAAPKKGEQRVPFNSVAGEAVTSMGDSYIVLTKDRPKGVTSGYFAGTNCSAIDVVTGRISSKRKQTLEKNPNFKANPSFKFDAARIYVCERTDIDDNFEIQDSGTPPARNKSAVGIKADGVRILAREGIKIISGMDAVNSRDQAKAALYGISLIGGYNVMDGPQHNGIEMELQPLVKGDNLLLALKTLQKQTAYLDTQFSLVHKMLIQIQSSMSAHMHVGVGATSPPVDPLTLFNAILTSIDTVMGTIEVNLRQYNHISLDNDFLTRGGKNYILSRYNRTT